jgi:hypothetical protein
MSVVGCGQHQFIEADTVTDAKPTSHYQSNVSSDWEIYRSLRMMVPAAAMTEDQPVPIIYGPPQRSSYSLEHLSIRMRML